MPNPRENLSKKRVPSYRQTEAEANYIEVNEKVSPSAKKSHPINMSRSFRLTLRSFIFANLSIISTGSIPSGLRFLANARMSDMISRFVSRAFSRRSFIRDSTRLIMAALDRDNGIVVCKAKFGFHPECGGIMTEQHLTGLQHDAGNRGS